MQMVSITALLNNYKSCNRDIYQLYLSDGLDLARCIPEYINDSNHADGATWSLCVSDPPSGQYYKGQLDVQVTNAFVCIETHQCLC